MKKSRILISVLLAVLIAAVGLSCVGCGKTGEQPKSESKNSDGFVIGIISDPQIVAESDVGDDDYASFQDFNAIGQKMLFVSEAILKTAVDRLIEKKVNVVLIPGDLTENGSKVGHETVARECARLEAAGIPVYVICGNHDINKEPEKYMRTEDALAQGLPIYEEFEDGTCSVSVSGVTPEDFMRIYNDFGYADAVALDKLDAPVQVEIEGYTYEESGTMSYVQDIPGSNYRLIAIDAANYNEKNGHTYYKTYYGSGANRKAEINGTGYSVMTERLLGWVETQLENAQEAKKTPLVMAHFPIANQMGEVVGLITDGIDNRMNMVDELMDLLYEYGVQYTFTGHLHTQHDVTYTSDFFNSSFTDIETGCLTNYPLPMRYLTVKDGKLEVENEYLAGVKAEYLPDYVNDAAIRKAVTEDLQNYALDPFIYDNLLYNFDRRISDDDEPYALFYDIFDMLELDPDNEHEEELAELAEYIYRDLYRAFMEMPLYEKSANGGMNLESICKKYGVTLPASAAYEDKGVFQFFIQLLGAFYKYDYASMGISGITYDGTEGTILRYGVYSIFEVLRTSELFTRLHAINPDIAEDVISERFVQKLFTEGTLDLACDNFITKLLTVINPVVEENLPISLENLDEVGIARTLKTLLPSVLPIANEFIPDAYDKNAQTILGVSIASLWKIDVETMNDEEVAYIEIYFDTLLKKVVFETIGTGVLN